MTTTSPTPGQRIRAHVERCWLLYLAVFVFALPAVTAGITRVAVDRSCKARGLVLHVLSFGNADPVSDDCVTVPLSIDWPSLVIWIPSVVAILTYSRYRRLLVTLRDDLIDEGVLPRNHTGRVGLVGRVPFPLGPQAHRWVSEHSIQIRALAGALLLGVLTVVGFRFNRFVNTESPWFDLLDDADDGYMREAVLRDGWWANFDTYPVNAVAWIAVGVIGSFFAVLQMMLHARFTWTLRQQSMRPSFTYVERWHDPDHGWSAFRRILLVIAVGATNFAVAFAAVSYTLLADRVSTGWTLVILVAMLGGTWMNYITITSLYRYVHAGFREARRAQVNRVLAISQARPDLVGARLDDLSGAGSLPIAGAWRHVPTVLTAAIGQLTLIFAFLKWGLGG